MDDEKAKELVDAQTEQIVDVLSQIVEELRHIRNALYMGQTTNYAASTTGEAGG